MVSLRYFFAQLPLFVFTAVCKHKATWRLVMLTLCLLCTYTFGYAQEQDSLKDDDSNTANQELPLDNVQEILHRYEEAEGFYNKGKIDSVPRILGVYLKNKSLLRKMEKGGISDIYRLSALSYILMDSLQEAERQIKNLLSNQHNYQIRQGDLLSFKASLDTLYISPRIVIGLQAGWLATFVQKNNSISVLEVINDNNNSASGISQDESYTIDYLGITAGFNLGYYFNRHFALYAELVTTNIGFNYQRLLATDQGGGIEYQYSQSLNYLEVPAYLQYNFFKQPNFTPYILAGAYYRYLGSSLKTISTTSVNATPLMQTHNFGALVGIGASKAIGTRWALRLDARYNYNVGNINKAAQRFMNNGEGNIDVFLYNAYDAIDDITIQNINVNLGITYFLRYKVF
jgi:outer membrane protein W